MVHSHKTFGDYFRCSCPFTCHMVDHKTAQIEVVRKSLSLYEVASNRGITVFTQQYICVWVSAQVFVRTTNEFNLNIYRLAVYLRL